MCGIAGILDMRGRRLAESRPALECMLDLMEHRGPDDRGSADFGEFLVGHIRLAILDLSERGHQPMMLDGTRLSLSYNGEIYNFLELRDELKSLGATFVSNTDTEVILHAYNRWGLDCFTRFNGMWALALWDDRRKELILSRDRVGIKPLYWSLDDDRLVFASELKAVAAYRSLTHTDLDLNLNPIWTYLDSGLVDGQEETFFKEIFRFKPGHTMVVRDGLIRGYRPFWDLPAAALKLRSDNNQKSEDQLAEELCALLDDAVQKHLRSDVPVGVCLSGGLDSSCVAGLASRRLPDLKTFTTWFAEGDEWNELSHADLVNRTFDLRPHQREVSGARLLEKLDNLLWYLDEPTLAMGIYPHWHVMETASREVTVVLDGQGGDEIFAGYDFYASHYLYGKLIEQNIKQYQRTLSGFYRNYGLVRTNELGQEVKRLFLNNTANKTPKPFPGHLDNILYRELLSSRLPALLRYEDRLSMAFSIESRVPLLDYRLIEFAFALPEEHKIGAGWSKHLFRRSMDGFLPKPITWRKDKKGFPTPFEIWAEGIHRESIRDHIAAPDSRVKEIFGDQCVERLLDNRGGRSGYYWQLWRLLSLEIWFRTYLPRLSEEVRGSNPETRQSQRSEIPYRLPEQASIEAIITIDYEAYDTNDFLLDANLTIDWERDLIQPTESLAVLLEKHGATLTILWDTAEYFWLVDHGEQAIAERIEKQLVDLVRRGHDVQLHIHPAWMTVHREGDRWLWENPGLTVATMSPAEFENLIERSVKTMNELFRPVRSDYAVRGFRARAYEVEPFSLIATTLLKHGIRADSSYHGVGPIPVRTPSLSQAVHPREADFLEFPIYSVNNQRWDFSGPPEFTNLPLKVPEPIPDRQLGLVMIGHSKQKIHYEALDACLSQLTKRHGTRLCFTRWQESIEKYLPHLHGRLFTGHGFGKDYFDACWDNEDPFHSSAVEDPYYQRILDLLPEDIDSLLDLGCAEGDFTQAMATRSKAKTVLGVDISNEAIRRAAQAHPQLEFQTKNLLHFEATKRLACVVSSQNIYYFTAAERAVLFAHIERLLAPEGQFLLAWWTGANRGYQEEGIEDEFKRFFKLAHSETYEGAPDNTIKGSHRILIGRRRLTITEEDLLNRIYWKGRTVLSLCSRWEDIKQRFGWMTKAWKTHLPHQGLAQQVDVLLVDVVNQERLEALKVNGALIVFAGSEMAANLEGVSWIKKDDSIALGAKSSSKASVNHLRGSQSFPRTPRAVRRPSGSDIDNHGDSRTSPLSHPLRPYYDTDDPFLRYIHPSKRAQKVGLNILITNCGSNVCEVSTLLMKAINTFTEHKARCVVAFPAQMTNEQTNRTSLLGYEEDLTLRDLGGDKSEAEELIQRADFFHCWQAPGLPGTSLINRLHARNCVVQYVGQEVFQNLDFLTEFHTRTGIIPILGMGVHASVNLPNRLMYFYPIVDLTRYGRCPHARPGEEIRLVHSPTSRRFKGTDAFLELVKPLEEEFNFKVLLIENKTHEECIRIKETCHLHFDQMTPWGYGISGMESMAMGQVVLCSMGHFRLSLEPDVPLVSISPTTLRETLRDLLKDPDRLNAIGDQAYHWVRRVYNPHKIIRQYDHLYQGIIQGFEATCEGILGPAAPH